MCWRYKCSTCILKSNVISVVKILFSNTYVFNVNIIIVWRICFDKLWYGTNKTACSISKKVCFIESDTCRFYIKQNNISPKWTTIKVSRGLVYACLCVAFFIKRHNKNLLLNVTCNIKHLICYILILKFKYIILL